MGLELILICSMLLVPIPVFAEIIKVEISDGIGFDDSVNLLVPLTVNDANRFEFIQFAYAQGNDVRPDFNWRVKVFLGDLHEWITINPVRLAELKLIHAEERQQEIQSYIDDRKPVPPEFEANRQKKIIEAERILSGEDTTLLTRFTDTINKLKQVGDFNEIKIAVSEFEKLREICNAGTIIVENDDFTMIAKAGPEPLGCQVLANEIDNRINSLDSIKQNCIGEISSLELSKLDDPYAQLQIQCPVLKAIRRLQANNYELLKGNGRNKKAISIKFK